MRLNDHLKRVAIAAIVTVVGLASSAKGDIVYQSANVLIFKATYNLDLNGDGVTDFAITSYYASYLCFWDRYVDVTAASGNGVVGSLPAPLELGNTIGSNQVFYGGGVLVSSENACNGGHTAGSWLKTTHGYLGLSFQINGETHYGWAELSLLGFEARLTGYAYETVPGKAIKAGQTSYAWFTPASLNFQTLTVGTNVSAPVTLANLGPTTLTITNATLTGNADFASESSNPPCGGSLATGAHCKLTFTFKPSIAGSEAATYSVFVNGGSSSLQLTGTGTYVEFTPASLNFGTVARGSSVSSSITLTNLSTTTLLISKATLTGANKADFASGNSNPPCGGSVPAEATCTLTFTFTPSISGNETATYYVYDNDGASPQKLKLIGTGQ